MADKITIPLPFLGQINENKCKGIKVNYRLFTQCGADICNKSTEYCSSCYKQATINTDNIPMYGNIYKRLELYRINKPFIHNGIKEELYGNVLNKLKISKEKAIKELHNANLTFDESIFNTNIKQRGRPKKDKNTEKTNTPNKKQRGRPKKNVNSLKIDDLYDETIHIDVELVNINNQEYYKDSNNNIYNLNFELIEL